MKKITIEIHEVNSHQMRIILKDSGNATTYKENYVYDNMILPIERIINSDKKSLAALGIEVIK